MRERHDFFPASRLNPKDQYPQFSDGTMIVLERELIKREVPDRERIMDALSLNGLPDLAKLPEKGQSTMDKMGLIVARLQASGIEVDPVMEALIPEYRKKLETLCGGESNLNLYPSLCLTGSFTSPRWATTVKAVFRHSEPLSILELSAVMDRAHSHPLQHIPELGVGELDSLLRQYGEDVPQPLVTPGKGGVWQIGSQKPVIGTMENLFDDERRARPGVHFAAMLEPPFFTDPVKD